METSEHTTFSVHSTCGASLSFQGRRKIEKETEDAEVLINPSVGGEKKAPGDLEKHRGSVGEISRRKRHLALVLLSDIGHINLLALCRN